MSVKEIPI